MTHELTDRKKKTSTKCSRNIKSVSPSKFNVEESSFEGSSNKDSSSTIYISSWVRNNFGGRQAEKLGRSKISSTKLKPIKFTLRSPSDSSKTHGEDDFYGKKQTHYEPHYTPHHTHELRCSQESEEVRIFDFSYDENYSSSGETSQECPKYLVKECRELTAASTDNGVISRNLRSSKPKNKPRRRVPVASRSNKITQKGTEISLPLNERAKAGQDSYKKDIKYSVSLGGKLETDKSQRGMQEVKTQISKANPVLECTKAISGGNFVGVHEARIVENEIKLLKHEKGNIESSDEDEICMEETPLKFILSTKNIHEAIGSPKEHSKITEDDIEKERIIEFLTRDKDVEEEEDRKCLEEVKKYLDRKRKSRQAKYRLHQTRSPNPESPKLEDLPKEKLQFYGIKGTDVKCSENVVGKALDEALQKFVDIYHFHVSHGVMESMKEDIMRALTTDTEIKSCSKLENDEKDISNFSDLEERSPEILKNCQLIHNEPPSGDLDLSKEIKKKHSSSMFLRKEFETFLKFIRTQIDISNLKVRNIILEEKDKKDASETLHFVCNFTKKEIIRIKERRQDEEEKRQDEEEKRQDEEENRQDEEEIWQDEEEKKQDEEKKKQDEEKKKQDEEKKKQDEEKKKQDEEKKKKDEEKKRKDEEKKRKDEEKKKKDEEKKRQDEEKKKQDEEKKKQSEEKKKHVKEEKKPGEEEKKQDEEEKNEDEEEKNQDKDLVPKKNQPQLFKTNDATCDKYLQTVQSVETQTIPEVLPRKRSIRLQVFESKGFFASEKDQETERIISIIEPTQTELRVTEKEIQDTQTKPWAAEKEVQNTQTKPRVTEKEMQDTLTKPRPTENELQETQTKLLDTEKEMQDIQSELRPTTISELKTLRQSNLKPGVYKLIKSKESGKYFLYQDNITVSQEKIRRKSDDSIAKNKMHSFELKTQPSKEKTGGPLSEGKEKIKKKKKQKPKKKQHESDKKDSVNCIYIRNYDARDSGSSTSRREEGISDEEISKSEFQHIDKEQEDSCWLWDGEKLSPGCDLKNQVESLVVEKLTQMFKMWCVTNTNQMPLNITSSTKEEEEVLHRTISEKTFDVTSYKDLKECSHSPLSKKEEYNEIEDVESYSREDSMKDAENPDVWVVVSQLLHNLRVFGRKYQSRRRNIRRRSISSSTSQKLNRLREAEELLFTVKKLKDINMNLMKLGNATQKESVCTIAKETITWEVPRNDSNIQELSDSDGQMGQMEQMGQDKTLALSDGKTDLNNLHNLDDLNNLNLPQCQEIEADEVKRKQIEMIMNIFRGINRREKENLWRGIRKFLKGKVGKNLTHAYDPGEVCIEIEQEITKNSGVESFDMGNNCPHFEGEFEVEVDLTLRDLERILNHRRKKKKRRIPYRSRFIKSSSSSQSDNRDDLPVYQTYRENFRTSGHELVPQSSKPL